MPDPICAGSASNKDPRDSPCAPSIRPGPTMPTSVRFSPQIRLLWKWLWPKSWYRSNRVGSAGSYPSAAVGGAAARVAPASSCRVMWLCRRTEWQA